MQLQLIFYFKTVLKYHGLVDPTRFPAPRMEPMTLAGKPYFVKCLLNRGWPAT
jgi:hypothetical protein